MYGVGEPTGVGDEMPDVWETSVVVNELTEDTVGAFGADE